ncbi:tetratricopeptide repeat protein [Microvirga sp. 17 mud 1-3]|uniref:tetratricopeptide repeat protein n=1 Tax=Microvirga sp. 17 mud 1-3 TaxID=2082949 RepID=UPI0013A5AFCD|nr:tetratricopeptide repeat protein [Microvirga sp. 17 mud 1-3]
MPLNRGMMALAVAGLAFAALAQQSGSPAPPQGPEPNASSASPRRQVDESALRYFASQGDTRRVDAEIARLRALYPDWSPPADLSQLVGGGGVVNDPEVDRLWGLYTENKFSEARAAIAARQAADPQWKPPPDLVTALDVAEARKRLVNASDNSQWRTVLSIATETPSLLTCANVDSLWRVAEAFAKTDQTGRTRDVYTYILTNCANPAERLGTLQKALTLLDEAQIADLLKYERKSGDYPDDFSAIRDELARRRVARASTDPKLTASAEDLAVVERLAESGKEPGNALLLGYYSYHHKNPEKALSWFKTALDRGGSEKAAEGYALSLRDLNRLAEAEAFAFEWRDKAPENMQVYLDVATALLSQDPPPRLDPKVIVRVIPAVTKARSAGAAQALGWYSYNTGQISTAREWFEEALSWKADDEPSAYGVAITSQRLNDRARFNAIVSQWRSRSQRIADLADGIVRDRTAQATPQPAPPSPVEPQISSPRAVAPAPELPAPPPERPRRIEETRVAAYDRLVVQQERQLQGKRPAARRGASRQACTTTRDPGSLSAPAALNLGWCLMEMNRPLEAAAAFDHAFTLGSPAQREDAAYGKSLAYLRKDLTGKAAVAAAQAPQTSARRTELSAAILAQRALAAYRDGRWPDVILALGERARVVPEQNDLMLLRGWSYFKLGRYEDAARIFRAVQQTGYSDEAGAGLSAIMEITGQVRQY